MRFNTLNGVAVFSTKDGVVYTAAAGVFTIRDTTHQIEATMYGMTPVIEAGIDAPGSVAVVTADAAMGGDAEVGDSAAALAALAAANNPDVTMPPE